MRLFLLFVFLNNSISDWNRTLGLVRRILRASWSIRLSSRLHSAIKQVIKPISISANIRMKLVWWAIITRSISAICISVASLAAARSPSDPLIERHLPPPPPLCCCQWLTDPHLTNRTPATPTCQPPIGFCVKCASSLGCQATRTKTGNFTLDSVQPNYLISSIFPLFRESWNAVYL